VYVFEGKPPELKMAQLKQRRERREEATEGLEKAKEAGDQEAIEKYGKRTIKVRPVHQQQQQQRGCCCGSLQSQQLCTAGTGSTAGGVRSEQASVHRQRSAGC
jgi:hypothetical protein